VIVVVEELVDGAVVRADPNRTLIPGVKVDAVVVCPGGAHPSFAQGYYDRDNRFYLDWEALSRDPERLEAWLDEWVRATADHREYLDKLGEARWKELRPGTAPSGSVDYGSYR
jgi:glutaconate CoA-transferase subunit A